MSPLRKTRRLPSRVPSGRDLRLRSPRLGLSQRQNLPPARGGASRTQQAGPPSMPPSPQEAPTQPPHRSPRCQPRRVEAAEASRSRAQAARSHRVLEGTSGVAGPPRPTARAPPAGNWRRGRVLHAHLDYLWLKQCCTASGTLDKTLIAALQVVQGSVRRGTAEPGGHHAPPGRHSR